MTDEGEKTCSLCGVEKPLEEFYRAASTTDGRQARCKACHLHRARDYRRRLKAKNDLVPPDRDAPKRCPSCEDIKPGHDFHRNRSSPDGLHWVCRSCNGGGPYSRQAEQRRRFRRYAISPEEVATLLEVQDRACAICGDPFDGASFHIDHCHVTDEVRGLLCSNCNTGLGLLGDDQHRLTAAIRYLRRPPIRSVRGA